LVLALEQQNVHHTAKGAGNGDELLLGGVVRKAANMEDFRNRSRFSELLPLVYSFF